MGWTNFWTSFNKNFGDFLLTILVSLSSCLPKIWSDEMIANFHIFTVQQNWDIITGFYVTLKFLHQSPDRAWPINPHLPPPFVVVEFYDKNTLAIIFFYFEASLMKKVQYVVAGILCQGWGYDLEWRFEKNYSLEYKKHPRDSNQLAIWATVLWYLGLSLHFNVCLKHFKFCALKSFVFRISHTQK